MRFQLCKFLLFVLMVSGAVFPRPNLMAATYTATLAGSGNAGVSNGPAADAEFHDPAGVAQDSQGNWFVADSYNHTIRKITPGGIVSVFAGSAGQQGSTNGTGGDARFYYPTGIAVDSQDRVYVADQFNHVIRRISTNAIVTTFVGSAGNSGSADGIGASARLYWPADITIADDNTLYVADTGNETVRKVTPAAVVTTIAAVTNGVDGITVDIDGNLFISARQAIHKVTPAGSMSTFAGMPGVYGHLDATGTAARFYYPRGLDITGAGEIYVADYNNHVVRLIDPNGVVSTFAGKTNSTGSINGQNDLARFHNPRGLRISTEGHIVISDEIGNVIREISFPTITDIASTNVPIPFAAGVTNTSIITISSIDTPVVDLDVTLTIMKNWDAELSVHLLSPQGTRVELFTDEGGSGTNFVDTALDDDAAASIHFSGTAPFTGRFQPEGAFTNFNGELPNGEWTLEVVDDAFWGGLGTLQSWSMSLATKPASFGSPFGNGADGAAAGIYTSTFAGSGNTGSVDGVGTAAEFYHPMAAAVDSQGNIFIADRQNHTIRKITPAGVVTTFAGSPGISGFTNETGSAAAFNYPAGVAIDSADNLYVADTSNNQIRKITPGAVVTTFAGAEQYGSTDGTGGAARFSGPTAVAIDGAGFLYVSDRNNHTIRKISPSANVTTLAGSPETPGAADGTGSSARFNWPYGIAVDSFGNVFVGDEQNHTIRKITPAGVVTTYAGTAGEWGASDGTGSAARFYSPRGLEVDGTGNLLVADQMNCCIRKISPAQEVTTLVGALGQAGSVNGQNDAARFLYPNDVAIGNNGDLFIPDWAKNMIRRVQFVNIVTVSNTTPLGLVTNATVTSTIPVSALSGAVMDVDVTLNIDQEWTSDLDVYLQSPTGTNVEMFTAVGSAGNNFTGTIMDDEAKWLIGEPGSGSTPFTGRFRPEGDLSAVEGSDPGGDWLLKLTQAPDAFPGTLQNWSLSFALDSSSDTDGDGLSDAHEIALGSDPEDTDSDDDGVEDGDEVTAGTNPTDANDVVRISDTSVSSAETGAVVIAWQSHLGRTYTLSSGTVLGTITNVIHQTNGNGMIQSRSYTNTSGSFVRFFRLGVD